MLISFNFRLAILIIGAAFLVCYHGSYLFLYDNAAWRIHDGLDSALVSYKVLAESSNIFSKNVTIIEQAMGGLPRVVYPSEFDYYLWLNYFWGAYPAYIINRFLISAVGFISCIYFLKKFLPEKEPYAVVPIICATCFALLPYWPYMGISISGLPLLCAAILLSDTKDNLSSGLTLAAIYAAFSSMITVGIFAIAFAFFFFLARSITTRSVSKVWLVILVFCVVSIIKDYRLFLQFIFDPVFTSHRVEFEPRWDSGWRGSIDRGLNIFLNGQTHSESLHTPVIIFSAIVCLILQAYYRLEKHIAFALLVLLSLALLIALWAGTINWFRMRNLLAPLTDVLPVNVYRFHMLSPFLWMIIWALSLSVIIRHFKYGIIFATFSFMSQASLLALNHESLSPNNSMTVKEFFSAKQFEELKKYIDLPLSEYRIGVVGIHPSVALFNGFHTIDGYFANYPLDYKHSFRNIISPELVKSSRNRQYFDLWGSRAYLFSSEIPDRTFPHPRDAKPLEEFEIDMEAFVRVGGDYLVSGSELLSVPSGFVFCTTLPGRDDSWSLFVYLAKVAERNC